MDILIVGSWLLTSVQTVNFICLFCVTTENILWSGGGYASDPNYGFFVIGGLPWLWSNKGVGFICLICLMVFSINVTISRRSINAEDLSKLMQKTRRYWTIFHRVLCLLQSIVGILWWWSHRNLLLYLALFAIVVYMILFMLCWAGIGRYNSGANQEIRAGRIFTWIWTWTMVVSVNVTFSALHIFENSFKVICGQPLIILGIRLCCCCLCIYEVICNSAKKFWGIMYHSMAPLGSTPEISVPSSTISEQHDEEEVASTLAPSCESSSSPKRGVSALCCSWQATIGQNVNIGGTQTIGSIRIGEHNIHIHANSFRDIVLSTYSTRGASRSL